MNAEPLNRRGFVKGALGTAFAAGVTGRQTAVRAAQDASGARAIRLGAPAYAKTKDPEKLALAHRKLGYRAAYCPNAEEYDKGRRHLLDLGKRIGVRFE
jgi:hypothetical protein